MSLLQLIRTKRRRAPEPMTGPFDDTIAGVTLAMYVSVSRRLADVGYDATKAPGLAADDGIGTEEWAAAATGWSERIHDDPSIARRFNALYVQR